MILGSENSSGHAAGLDDGEEISRLQGGTANQAPVDVGHGQQGRGIGRIHAAPVQHGHPFRMCRGGPQLGTQHRMHRLGLLGRGCLASTDGPESPQAR